MRFVFFNESATTEIYTLSLHDALPIFQVLPAVLGEQLVERVLRAEELLRVDQDFFRGALAAGERLVDHQDRKSTRLNSSHSQISYAVFCLKKKNQNIKNYIYKSLI